MKLRAPFARVQIGDKATGNIFQTGDGRLRYVQVQLGEDKRSSRCRFEVYDPQLQIGAKYFELSFKQGGIQVPPDLLSDPDPPVQESAAASAGQTSAGGSSSQNTSLTPEMRAFLDTIAFAEGTSGADGYNTIFTHAKFSGYSRHPAQLKCSGSLCSDAAGRYQFLSTTWKGLGLGDFSPANQDKGAAILIARRGAAGDVQRGLPGLKDALRKCALEWASLPGSPYGQPTKSYSTLEGVYKKALAKYKGGATPPTAQPPATPPPTPPAPAAAAAAKQTPLKDKADTKPEEISNKGTEIIVELGYEETQLISYHFIHTGTHTKGRMLDSTVFEGQCIRWLMTRRTKNSAYGNTTLKELATKVAGQYGLTVEMEGDGPKFQHLDQSGISDYELLLREARAIGYSIKEEKNKLILKPYRPEYKGFVITQDILQDIQFSDKASKDMPANSGSSASATDTSTQVTKTKIDRLSGIVKQVKLEDSTAVGKGKAADSKVKIDLATIDDAIAQQKAAQAKKNQTTAAKTEAANSTAVAIAKPDKKTNTKPVATTGSPVKPVTGTPAPSSAKNAQAGEQSKPATTTTPAKEQNAPADAETGLPKQEVGLIDLADGKAEAEVIADESRRVKGYESSATVKTTPEALTLAPGQIVGVSKDIAPGVFSREWRLGSVTHTLQGGVLKTDLDFYSPQKMKPESKTTTAGTATAGAIGGATASLGGPTTSSGWASPMKVSGNSSCGAVCEFGYARGRLHAGIDYGGYGTSPDPDGVFAASNGTVTFAGSMGGYGLTVDIKRPDGWSSRYAHLAKIDVKQGQVVNQGVRVGTRGNTGGNYAIHLHFEIRDPSGTPKDPRQFLPKPQIPRAG